MPAARTTRTRATSKVVPAGSDSDFTFKSTKGDITVPSMASVEPTFAILEAVKANDNLAVVVETAKNCASAAAMKVIRQLRITEMDKFYSEWADFSGVGMGESPAS